MNNLCDICDKHFNSNILFIEITPSREEKNFVYNIYT